MPDLEKLKYQIFYADDDSDDIYLVRESIKKYAENVELISFENGLDLLVYLKRQPKASYPCLIMLDINMPFMDGKETLQEIRKVPSFEVIPVIFFSTSSQPVDRMYAAKNNAGFITKPIDYLQMDLIAGQLIQSCTDEVQKRIIRHF